MKGAASLSSAAEGSRKDEFQLVAPVFLVPFSAVALLVE